MSETCVICKGRGLCGRPVCPILRRFEEIRSLPKLSERIEGLSPPEVFVGKHGYPLVRAGPMVPLRNDSMSPSLRMNIEEIISMRTSMIRSETKLNIMDAGAPGKLLEACQQIGMSSAPVGTEVSFISPPQSKLQFDGILAPSGPSAIIKELDITTNPFVPRKVDQVVDDRDASAFESMGELYQAGIDLNHISRLLSLGLLGRKRKLVPTRWSITASDDMIGKELKDRVQEFSSVSDYLLFSSENLGNHFEILLMPRNYSFELIEIWMPGSIWSPKGWIGSDSEDLRSKKEYSSLAGGYYSARLAVLEHLAVRNKQASVLALREISDSYWAPLGVWVVREVARAAMSSNPLKFATMEEAIKEISLRVKTPLSIWLKHANLAYAPVQRRLIEFFI